MDTVFDSSDLPAHQRTDAWVEITARALMTTRFTFFEPEGFAARLQVMSLGAVQVSAMSYASLQSQRTPALIRQSDPECYAVALVKNGWQGIEQARHNSVIGTGCLVLYDSSRPFTAIVPESAPLGAETLILQFPKKLLPLPDRQVNGLLAAPLPTSKGIGRLLAQFLTGMAEEQADYTPRDTVRLASAAIDLVAATLAHHLDREATMPPESRQRILFLQISSFIQEHLAEPELGPTTIAPLHQISLRYLHRIFQQQGTTVSAFIRQLRLDRCRRDLTDPGLHHLTVHAIGTRWGFTRPADFSRAFRTCVGMPPGEYRTFARQLCATSRGFVPSHVGGCCRPMGENGAAPPIGS
ncbi:helix-turn-helix domain-containing protein [Streptomyces mirabilis]|uniref:AraC-like ligand-binding domain-containing protein n=1 Tax=Streptomyces mirabilis TaxID=68239 RepID=UPI003813DA3F